MALPSLGNVNLNYFLPFIALLIFLILFFILRKPIKNMLVPQAAARESAVQSHYIPIRLPTLAPKRIKKYLKWRDNMKFVFTQFYGFGGKDHLKRTKAKSPLDQLKDMVK